MNFIKFFVFVLPHTFFFSCSLSNIKDIPFHDQFPLGGGQKFENMDSTRQEELQSLFEQPIQSGITLQKEHKSRELPKLKPKDNFVTKVYEKYESVTDSIYLHTFLIVRNGDPLYSFDSVYASKYVSKFIFYQDTLLVNRDIVNDGSSQIPYNWTIVDITEVILRNNKKYFVVSINEEPYNGEERTPCRDIVIDTSLKTMRLGENVYFRY